MTPSQCTCAQSPSTRECTRSPARGKCLQRDCAPFHKCDCFGYELCSIGTCGKWSPAVNGTCGKWSPAVNAILSRTAEFQCKYEKDDSKCREATAVSDTLDSSRGSADNAKAASTKYVDDIAVDEAELVADLKESITFKIQTLDVLRAITNRIDEVVVGELKEVTAISDKVMEETMLNVKETGEVNAASAEAYEAMGKARDYRAEAREHEAAAEAEQRAEEEASNEATAKNVVCEPCVAMKARIVQLRNLAKLRQLLPAHGL